MKKDYQEWISAIENKIIEPEDKIIFNEVIQCMKIKCYRAAFILSWISLVESIKRKINQYASLGDKNAEQAVEKIDQAELQKLSVDKLIYDKAKECGIIDDSELSILNFLWERRCLFAHPYEKQPELDEVKYIINQSVNLALGKELLFNKNYIDELCNNISEKPFFLPKEVEQVREFSRKIVARTPERLYPFFFKTLLYKISLLKDDETKTYELRKLRYFILELFSKTSKPLEDSEWGLENRATKFPFESYLGIVHYQIWDKIPDRVKEMLISYLEYEQNTGRLFFLKAITKNLIINNVLEERLCNRYFRILEKQTFEAAIDYYGDPKIIYRRITTGLETNSYETQNPIIDYLKTESAISLISGLDNNKQFYLGQLLSQAALNNHWKSQYFINSIILNEYNYSDFVKSGIAIENIFTIKKVLRIDKNEIQKAIEIFNSLNLKILKYSIVELEQFLEINKPSDWEKELFDKEKFRNEMTKILTSISWSSQYIRFQIETLILKINKYFD